MKDEIIEEIRSNREAYARRFNYDLRAIGRDLQARQSASGHEVVRVPAKRIKPVVYESEPPQDA